MNFQLPASQEFLTEISRLDRFQGTWSAQQTIPPDRLRHIREAARIQAAAASSRLAGIRVTDAEVAGLLRGSSQGPPADAEEIAGYARALETGAELVGSLLDGDALQRLHATMMGGAGVTMPTPWRAAPLDREAFDADGKATGRVFPTLPPRFVPRKTDELATWLELELRSGNQHPVLVVGTFALCLLSISPFERGNGRLARLCSSLLLERAGYGAIPYASLEARMEQLRDAYQDATSRSQTGLWTDSPELGPWLSFFLEVLAQHREAVELKMELERSVSDYPPLQRAILETVREHGTVDAGLLLKATGANRNTLKDNLRRMCQRGVLEKIGQRRGTRYRMSAGEGAVVRAGDPGR